jgi:hypothetical protein
MAQKITIKVSKDFEVPDIYFSDSTEDIEEALWIGATIQQSVRAYRSDSTILNIKESSEKEILHLKQNSVERELKLKSQIEELEINIDKLKTDHLNAVRQTRHESSEAVRRELQDKIYSIESSLKGSEERRRQLEETRQDDIRKATEREHTTMERIISEKEKEITRLDSSLKVFQTMIAKQTEEIAKLSNAFGKKSAASSNAKLKGSTFENEFRDALSVAYSTIHDFDIKNTAHGGGHEGDFITTLEGEQIMWELKDYSGVVPKAEVDKFLRDMKGAKGVRIGVMIAKTTDIIGKHGPIVIEQNEENLLIFINRFEEWEENNATSGGIAGGIFNILLQMFRFWWKIAKRFNNETSDDDDEVDELKHRIDECLKMVQKQAEDLKLRKTQWRTNKSRIEEALRWVAELMDESQHKLDRVMKILQSDLSEPDNVAPHRSTRSPVIPTMSSSRLNQIFIKDIDEKKRKWVDEIMKICVFGSLTDEDDCVKIAYLVEKLSETNRMAPDTIRNHITSIIQEDRVEKHGSSKVIRGLKIL